MLTEPQKSVWCKNIGFLNFHLSLLGLLLNIAKPVGFLKKGGPEMSFVYPLFSPICFILFPSYWVKLEIATRWVGKSQDELRKLKTEATLNSALSIAMWESHSLPGCETRVQRGTWYQKTAGLWLLWVVQQCTKSSKPAREAINQVHQLLLQERVTASFLSLHWILDYLLNDSYCMLWWFITSKSILITEYVSCNLKVTALISPVMDF